MSERGLRQWSTNHLCGKGYWVWMIPLSSGAISVGIVADPRFHPYEEMKTLDDALAWIRRYEPQLADSVDGRIPAACSPLTLFMTFDRCARCAIASRLD